MNWRQCQGTLAPDRPAEKTNTDLRFSVKRAAGLARSKSEDEWEQFKVRLKETDPMCEQASLSTKSRHSFLPSWWQNIHVCKLSQM